MTFQTDRPFFPYREPEDQRQQIPGAVNPQRLLRVYLLSNSRMVGKLGDQGQWPGQTVHAAPINSDQQEQLVRALNGESRPIVVSVQVDGKEIARAANKGYEQGGDAWAMLERMVRQMVPA